MHVVSRILFWSSLVGLALALVAPIVSSGASWAEAEAEVGVVVGLVFAFGIARGPRVESSERLRTTTRTRSGRAPWLAVAQII